MDDPFMSALALLAQQLGVDILTLTAALPVLVFGLNMLGRFIPDDATGWQGVVRKIAKIGGLYISNRVSSGITVNDIAKVASGVKAIQETPKLAEKIVEVQMENKFGASTLPPPNETVQEISDYVTESNKAPPPAPMFPGFSDNYDRTRQ